MDYSTERAEIAETLSELGAVATVSRVTSSYDATEGEHAVSAVQTDPADAVNLPATSARVGQFDNDELQQIRHKMRFFYLSADRLTFEPQPGDLLAWANSIFQIVGATPFSPAGVVLYYRTLATQTTLTEIPTVPA